jgi:hypothetical protein
MGFWNTGRRLTMTIAFGAAVLLPIAGCGDDGDGGDGDSASDSANAAVEDSVRAALKAQSDGNVEEFLKYWTDAGLEAEFQATPAEVREGGSEEIQTQLEALAFRATEVNGTAASTEVDIEAEDTYIFGRKVALIQEGDIWRINNTERNAVAPPGGTKPVSIGLTEFAFQFQPGDFTTSAALDLKLSNVGKQPHEMVLFKLDEGVNLQEALQSEQEPEGIEFVAAEMADPGEAFNIVLTKNLAAGRYGMVCFLPDTADPAGTPHAFKGMVTEFNLQ